MRRAAAAWLLTTILLGLAACGGTPEERRLTATRAVSTPHSMPTSTPASGEPMALDPDALFPEYEFTQTDRFWVQLDHRTLPETTIVVGIDPRSIEADIEAQLREHVRQFDAPGSRVRPVRGSLESPVLGRVVWSRAEFGGDDVEMLEIAIFTHHPRDQTLVIARSEFPADTADAQLKLDELVTTAEAIVPEM